MNMNSAFLLAGLVVGASLPAVASLPLTESTFTEIIHEANVVGVATKTVAPARTNDLFKVPDLVRTGQASRVELTAKDQTITRIGANTTFTFAPGGRDIQLERGSVLFHSPAGVGGGAVTHHGASAAVLGTTEICCVLPDGRFKILDLEGHVKVTLNNHLFALLKPGQMVIVSADGTELSSVATFNLGELAPRLLLAMGFSHPLSSMPLIAAAIQAQNLEFATGQPAGLVSWHLAGLGLETLDFPARTNSPYYLENSTAEWNPLDFPGQGPIGPGGYRLFPAGLPPELGPPIVVPPVTDPSGFFH